MKLEIFSLCDYASDYGQGKLNVIGTFDSINAPVFPFKLPQCAVAARLRIGNHETGNHNFEIRFLDGDGKEFNAPLKGDLSVMKHPFNDYTIINIAVNIGGLNFQKAGKYAVEFHWDGEFETGLTVTATQAQDGMKRAA